jgi:hypothetical protein
MILACRVQRSSVGPGKLQVTACGRDFRHLQDRGCVFDQKRIHDHCGSKLNRRSCVPCIADTDHHEPS